MLQRIQSVYMLIAAIAVFLMFAFPITQYSSEKGLGEFSLCVSGVSVELNENWEAFLKEKFQGEVPDDFKKSESRLQKMVIAEKNEKFSGVFLAGQLLVVLLGCFIIFAIFQFKNRSKQKAIVKYLMLASLAAFITVFIAYLQGKSVLIEDYGKMLERVFNYDLNNISASYGISLFLPVVSTAMLLMAHLNIKKDEAAIKAIDRLR